MHFRVASLAAAALVAFATAGSPAEAAYTVTLTKSGGDVFAVGSGSLNTTGFPFTGDAWVFQDGIEPSSGTVLLGQPSGTNPNSTVYGGTLSGPTNFGSGGLSVAGTGTGDRVALSDTVNFNEILVPLGYVSGHPLESTAAFAGTFASLGITPGSYTWTWGSGNTANSFTLNVDAPEPASASLLALAAAALLARRRRRH